MKKGDKVVHKYFRDPGTYYEPIDEEYCRCLFPRLNDEPIQVRLINIKLDGIMTYGQLDHLDIFEAEGHTFVVVRDIVKGGWTANAICLTGKTKNDIWHFGSHESVKRLGKWSELKHE